MAYRLVIFDFDGTLADSAAWVLGALNGTADRYGFRRVSGEEAAMLRGWDNRAIIRYMGVPAWKLPLIARHVRALIAKDTSGIPLFEGTRDLLRTLADRGVTMAVVSSNSESNVRRILGPECSALIGCYECGAAMFGKAARFRRVLARTGTPGNAAICIGDEARDIEAAAEAGLASGAVAWGYATPEFLERQRPTMMFGSMAEIADGITGRGGPAGASLGH